MSTATATPTTMKLTRLLKGAARPLTKGAAPASKPTAAPKAAAKPKAVKAVPAPKAAKPPKAPKTAKEVRLNPKSNTPRRSLGIDRNDNVTLEQSLARMAALDKLMETSRRSAKSTLWRDLLGSSLPQAGNIRSGKGYLRDELADRITEAMGLPTGWLDNPVFPPPTLASWVTDENVPLPGKKKPSVPTAHQEYSEVKMPFLRPGKAKREPVVTMAPGAEAQGSAQTAPAQVPQAQPQVAAAPAPAAAAPVTLKVEHATPHTAEGNTFYWKGSPNPQAIPAPGPLTQAAISVLQVQATSGKFTEADAMRLLQYLSTQG